MTSNRQAAVLVERSEGARPLDVDVNLGIMRESVSFQLRHTSWAVHNAFGVHFSQADAVPRQYSVLYLISINPGLNVKSLAAAIGVDQSTLVPTLNVCEEHGWIVRGRVLRDRRFTALDLTDLGRSILDDLQMRLTGHENAIVTLLDESERLHLMVLLSKVRKAALALAPAKLD